MTPAGHYRHNAAAAMRVLIVPDKFKGTLTAPEAARAIGRGWKRARPGDSLDRLPMSDGGDGFGRVICGLIGAQRRSVMTEDAAHRPRRAAWWWEPRSRTAIIESAETIGLTLLSESAPHPFKRDTTGLGRLLIAVARQCPARCFIGVGGSATNDAGFGMARALGWKFMDQSKRELHRWTDLARCRNVTAPGRKLSLGRVTVAVDVANPLLGPRGSTRVYGPQKGMRPQDFDRAEECLRRLARLMNRKRGSALDTVAGAGAAGGLGYGLMAFLNARPVSGFELFSKLSKLASRIRRADLVVTGEGGLDDQSLMGKGVGRVMALSRNHGTPCIALAGFKSIRHDNAPPLSSVHALAPDFVTLQEALHAPALHLARLATHIAANRLWT